MPVLATEPQQLLEMAQNAGVQVVVKDGRIRAIRGMWWLEDVMNAIWDNELAIVALLTPSIFDLARHVIDGMSDFLN